MQRVTITLDDELAAELDRVIASRGYQNRSEAIRDLTRAGLRDTGAPSDSKGGPECVAALVYVYDHEARQLAKRLTGSFHDRHDMSLATLHVHLDHDSCMEVNVLRGVTAEVRHLADRVIAERGVRHGKLVTIPVQLESARHAHGAHSADGHSHRHEAPGRAAKRKHLHVHVRQTD
jgi:CopG family nickel-responsive transcriptional regulator